MPSTEQLEQSASARMLDRDSIPNFDLRGLMSDDDAARSMLVEQVRSACLETGCRKFAVRLLLKPCAKTMLDY